MRAISDLGQGASRILSGSFPTLRGRFFAFGVQMQNEIDLLSLAMGGEDRPVLVRGRQLAPAGASRNPIHPVEQVAARRRRRAIRLILPTRHKRPAACGGPNPTAHPSGPARRPCRPSRSRRTRNNAKAHHPEKAPYRESSRKRPESPWKSLQNRPNTRPKIKVPNPRGSCEFRDERLPSKTSPR